MKKINIVFALICGLAIAWIGADFFGKYAWIFFLVLPILAIIGLWLTDLIGKKILPVRRARKFVLLGFLPM